MREKYGEKAADHLHFDDGFTLVAEVDDAIAGFLVLRLQVLPAPLVGKAEAFIDIIEVGPAYRRQGIASQLLQNACDTARETGSCQVRAWSSIDKMEAIPLRLKLEFGLVPAVIRQWEMDIHGLYAAKVLD